MIAAITFDNDANQDNNDDGGDHYKLVYDHKRKRDCDDENDSSDNRRNAKMRRIMTQTITIRTARTVKIAVATINRVPTAFR